MNGKRWAGAQVRAARAQVATMLPAPCCRCGKLVRPDDNWQADHYPVPRELGGTQLAPAHARCNMRAGGQRGAQLTNARRSRKAPNPGRVDQLANGMRGV